MALGENGSLTNGVVTTMDRRKFILSSSAAVITLTAGCGGSDTADSNVSDDNDEPESDDGEMDAEEVEQRPAGENVLEFNDLEIIEYEFIVDEDAAFGGVTVEGIVENHSDDMYDYVEVGVRVYDSDGHMLDRYFTNTTDLQAGGTWRFEVLVMEDDGDVSDFDISVTGSQY